MHVVLKLSQRVRKAVLACATHCKLHNAMNGPDVTSNPIVDVAYIPTVSQLDDDTKTLLCYMNYCGDISPVLFNLGATTLYESCFWTITCKLLQMEH